MRVACVLITHLRAKVELQRQPHLGNSPVVIADRSRRPLVADRLPACKGVVAGMLNTRNDPGGEHIRRLIPLRERETCACTMATSPTARLYDERPHEPDVSA